MDQVSYLHQESVQFIQVQARVNHAVKLSSCVQSSQVCRRRRATPLFEKLHIRPDERLPHGVEKRCYTS